ncbi:HEAT repeat domain-containing protein [Planctomycetota bacterium]
MDNPPEQFEKLLGRYQVQKPGKNLPGRIWKKSRAMASESPRGEDMGMPDTLQRTGTKKILYWLPVLAAAVFLMFIAIQKFRQNSSAEAVAPNGKIAIHSAKDEFYVLRTNPAMQAILVQEYAEFQVQYQTAGDKVGKYQLVNVRPDELTLLDSQGGKLDISVTEINSQSGDKLRDEVASLALCYKAGQLDAQNMDRLKRIALYGERTALKLIEKIAASDSNHRQAAEITLSANKSISSIRELDKWARSGDRAARIQAIRALGKIDSPIALLCLRETAIGPDAEMARYPIAILGQRNDEIAISHLQYIVDHAAAPEARQLAEVELKLLLEDIDHDK